MPHKSPEARRAYFKTYYERHKVRIAKRMRKYSEVNRAQIASRQKDWVKTSQLKRYGLTLEAYEQMRKEGCGVCGVSDRLHMDHDHVTGKFRGMLCSNHNLALGLFQDNTHDLQTAINYLRRIR